MADVLHGLFVVLKFLFGLGALVTLLGIGIALVWYVLYHIVRLLLKNQPASRYPGLRRLFLETPSTRYEARREPLL
jgi:hypothetical protein